MDATLLAVGADLAGRKDLAAALAPLGCRLQIGTVKDALAELQGEPGRHMVALGCDVRQDDAAGIAEHLKLSERLNRVGLLMLTRSDPAAVPVTGLRIEPDLYVKAPVDTCALVDTVKRLRSLMGQRAESGVRLLLELTMPSDIMLLRSVEAILVTVLKCTESGPKDVWGILQCMREVGLNAIEWGNKGVRARSVRFVLSVDRERFSGTVRDEGQGFDPRNLPHAADPANPLGHIAIRETSGIRVGGYGILICRGLMDTVRYNDVGNEVTLIKRLRPAATGEGAEP